MENTYDQGSDFIGHEFRRYLLEREYRITDKPITLINPTTNAILKQIHRVIVKLLQTLTLHKPMLTKMTHSWAFWLQQNLKFGQRKIG